MSSIFKRLKLATAERMLDYLQRYQNPGHYEWSKTHRDRLAKFKDLHRGQDCFIIGNGPSLNKMDLSRLDGFHLFGMNKIFLMFERAALELSYHVAVNPHVIEQSLPEFRKLNCPSFLAYQNCPREEQLAERFEFLFTAGAPLCFRESLMRPLNEGYTVTFVALQMAYFMGFKRVFLIGVDHNFKAKGTPNETQTMDSDDADHFDPRYFAGQKWQLPDLEGSEVGYHMANFYFRRDGREIFDATVDGKLQVFPKLSFDEAVSQAKPRLAI